MKPIPDITAQLAEYQRAAETSRELVTATPPQQLRADLAARHEAIIRDDIARRDAAVTEGAAQLRDQLAALPDPIASRR